MPSITSQTASLIALSLAAVVLVQTAGCGSGSRRWMMTSAERQQADAEAAQRQQADQDRSRRAWEADRTAQAARADADRARAALEAARANLTERYRQRDQGPPGCSDARVTDEVRDRARGAVADRIYRMTFDAELTALASSDRDRLRQARACVRAERAVFVADAERAADEAYIRVCEAEARHTEELTGVGPTALLQALSRFRTATRARRTHRCAGDPGCSSDQLAAFVDVVLEHERARRELDRFDVPRRFEQDEGYRAAEARREAAVDAREAECSGMRALRERADEVARAEADRRAGEIVPRDQRAAQCDGDSRMAQARVDDAFREVQRLERVAQEAETAARRAEYAAQRSHR